MAVVEVEYPAEGVGRIVLNRPECLNALNFELVGALHDALDDIAARDACKAVILTGKGRGFCSGLDLKDWGPLPAVGEHRHRRSGTTGQSFISSLTTHLQDTPQIIIAAVNGLAYGGGLALSLACDLRFASRSASFCSAFVRTGLTGTDIGISYFLPRLIGASRAFDLMVTGRSIDADEALSMGLVSQLLDEQSLSEHTLAVAQGIAGYTAVGLRMTKEAMWANLNAPDLASCLALENRNQDLAGQTDEVQRYMRNYRERFSK